MILVDINILLYAIDADSPHHRRVLSWWESALASNEPVGLYWTTVIGFVRVCTQHRSVEKPIEPVESLRFVDEWLNHPNVMLVDPAPNHWELFCDLIVGVGRAGKLTTDAHLAAIAIGNGAQLASCDVDFSKFSKLRWVNPLAS